MSGKDKEIGTLIVVVLKARNLNDKHKFRKQDAFAKITLNGKEQQTKVEVKGGQHPVWDEEFRWPIYQSTDKKHRSLEISCFSKEPREDDLLGKGSIDISETLRTGEFDDWVPLSMENVVRGDVYLEMTYYANGPPPPAATPPVAITPAPAPSAILDNLARPPTAQPRPPMSQARPMSTLGVPQPYFSAGSNLMRRPSKLSPSERLSRPSGNPPASYANARPYHTPMSPIADERQHRLSNAQPPFIAAEHQQRPPSAQPPASTVPNFLRPGAVSSGIRPVSDPIASANPYLTGAASTARPGTAQPGYQRPVSATPAPAPAPAPAPSSNPYLSSGTTSPNPVPSVQYNGAPSPAPEQYPPQQHVQQQYQQPQQQQQQPQYQQPQYQQQQQQPQQQPQYQQSQNPNTPAPPPGAIPVFWAAQPNDAPPTGGFAFPMPSVSGPHESAAPQRPGREPSITTPPIPGAYPPTPNAYPGGHPSLYGHRRRDSDPRDDPVLRARYQTPLPLPPGAPRPAAAARSPPAPRSPPLPPPPATQSPPLPPPPSYALPTRSPPRSPKSEVDRMRLAQLKWAEDEAARRREQEIKDMEMAMKLDREMNGLA